MPTYASHEWDRVISQIALQGMYCMVTIMTGQLTTQNVVVPMFEDRDFWQDFVDYWREKVAEHDSFFIYVQQPENI